MDSKRTDIHEKIAAATDQERGDLILPIVTGKQHTSFLD